MLTASCPSSAVTFYLSNSFCIIARKKITADKENEEGKKGGGGGREGEEKNKRRDKEVVQL